MEDTDWSANAHKVVFNQFHANDSHQLLPNQLSYKHLKKRNYQLTQSCYKEKEADIDVGFLRGADETPCMMWH